MTADRLRHDGRWHYGRVPIALICDERIGASAIRLYALLDDYCGNSDVCWPHQTTLAKRIGMSRRTVQRAVDELSGAGWVTVQHRYDKSTGATIGNIYTLMRISEHPGDISEHPGDTDVQGGVSDVAPTPVTQMAHKNQTQLEPDPGNSSPLSAELVLANALAASRGETDDGFGQFWAMYPRKVGKAEARKAWGKLNDSEQNAAQGAVMMLSTCFERSNELAASATVRTKIVKFTPYPATWLNQGRWEDDPNAVMAQYASLCGQNLDALAATGKTSTERAAWLLDDTNWGDSS